ncbi:TPA: hypothetical protein N0F65_004549 [Lagenidium giganteum]|uniref:Serine-threonine/tyrosine-protein kinase catalytic domain-containing protein n=1 Tax=Lagenidium giganteum TaxID=4803 RepID=A0AAV2ZF38_9STRA|nr:TPA: hypothetical protein N0F65_004549 [Lagenidium giganteum]
MKQTLGKIASVSQIDVDGIPDWFISPDDIDYCSKPFTCGVSGALHRGKWGQGTRVVVKTLTVEASMMNFVPPIALWHNLSHPHVLKLFGACHVSSPPFIVCEDATFGNLHDYLTKPSNRDNIWRLLLQAALGM